MVSDEWVADRDRWRQRAWDLEAEVADLKVRISAAVSVLTGLADRLGVDDEDLAGMLADAQVRAEDNRDVP